MKDTTKSILINFFLFLIYFGINFYRMWGESGGDLALIYLVFIGLVAQIIIVTPIVSFLLNKEKFFKTYFFGFGGVILGVFAGFIILQVGYMVLNNQFLERNPYYYSNYNGPDSTEYTKYNIDSDVNDFSNVNELTIRKVSLNDLGLKELPAEITSIDSLEDLSLSVNKGMDFSNSFSKLKNPEALKKLSLVNCGLNSLPKEILRFTNLEKLYIGGNPNLDPKQTIELLSKLKNLNELWIQGNEWEYLPDNFSELRSLKLLYAKRNKISVLPESINELDSLKKIFIYDNPVAQNYIQFIDTSKIEVFADR